MTNEDKIIVPRWFLEVVENTLQIQYTIDEPDKKKTGESCQDRNIRQSLNGIRKLLKGEELTGMERLEKLQPSLPSNLDEAAGDFGKRQGLELYPFAKKFFKTGAEWMAGQGITKEAVIGMATEEISINVSQQTLDELDLCPGDKVVVQIRKK